MAVARTTFKAANAPAFEVAVHVYPFDMGADLRVDVKLVSGPPDLSTQVTLRGLSFTPDGVNESFTHTAPYLEFSPGRVIEYSPEESLGQQPIMLTIRVILISTIRERFSENIGEFNAVEALKPWVQEEIVTWPSNDVIY